MNARKFLPSLVARLALAAAACIQPPANASADSPKVSASVPQTETVRNKQAVQAAFDRWAAGGTDFFAETLSPDVVWTIAGSGRSSGTYRGLEDFKTRAVLPFTSRLRTSLRPTSRTVWADGDHIIAHWSGEAVAGDGEPYRNRYVWIFRMRGGKAVEVTAFLDLAPYEDVIRRVPAPAAEASGR
jgi:uncharacterized protein